MINLFNKLIVDDVWETEGNVFIKVNTDELKHPLHSRRLTVSIGIEDIINKSRGDFREIVNKEKYMSDLIVYFGTETTFGIIRNNLSGYFYNKYNNLMVTGDLINSNTFVLDLKSMLDLLNNIKKND